MTYVIADDPKEAERISLEVWLDALGIDGEGQRAWCPGASPPDNSCPPSNKGGGPYSGGVKKDGKGRKVGRTPPRKPTAREIAVAAREGTAGRQIAARKVVAAHFLHEEGKFYDRNTGKMEPLDEGRFRGQMKAIDWTKPVQVGPPPNMPPPGEFVQWQAPGNIPPAGGYFAAPGTEPESLGIGRLGTAWSQEGQPVTEKVPHRFKVSGTRKYIRSTAAKADDNWSIKGGRVQRATGGGRQWFVPDAQAGGGIDEFVLQRSRRTSRAFCPGVSPPDNSCSPSNKGEGSPREQSLAKKHGLTPKQAKWALRMIDDLEKKFAGPGRAAAVSEVLSAAKYPKYLNGILESTPTKSEIEAVMAWSVRRGRAWEPAARAFCPGASPPDNSCSPANKGDAAPAKARGTASLKEARERYKKELASLRRKVALAEGRANRRLGLAAQRRNDVTKEYSAAFKKDVEVRLKYGQLKARYDETGDQSYLEEAGRLSQELWENDANFKRLAEEEKAATAEWREAWQEISRPMHEVLKKEGIDVDKEDGLTLRERRDATKAAEDAHAVERLVDDYVSKNGDNQLINQQSPEIARFPYASEQREKAMQTLRDIANNSIHSKALEAPIEYRQGVRANAAGFVEITDYTDYSPLGLSGEFLQSIGRGGVQEMTVVGRVQLDASSAATVILHEYGHQIEHGNAEAARLCDDFLKSRTAGETPVSLRERFPDHGFDSSEIGSPDNFARAFRYVDGGPLEMDASGTAQREAFYAGKRYEHQGRITVQKHEGAGEVRRTTIGSTEVLSMGLELMARSPARFAKADPEWFDLIAGITTGRILSETRERRRRQSK